MWGTVTALPVDSQSLTIPGVSSAAPSVLDFFGPENPGLTAGPFDCRPFGPHRVSNVTGWRRPDQDRDKIPGEGSSAGGAAVSSPGREAGVGNSNALSAEGATHSRFERFSNQASALPDVTDLPAGATKWGPDIRAMARPGTPALLQEVI